MAHINVTYDDNDKISIKYTDETDKSSQILMRRNKIGDYKYYYLECEYKQEITIFDTQVNAKFRILTEEDLGGNSWTYVDIIIDKYTQFTYLIPMQYVEGKYKNTLNVKDDEFQILLIQYAIAKFLGYLKEFTAGKINSDDIKNTAHKNPIAGAAREFVFKKMIVPIAHYNTNK